MSETKVAQHTPGPPTGLREEMTMENRTSEVVFGDQTTQNYIEISAQGDYFAQIVIVGQNGRQVKLDAERLQHHIAACQAQLAEMLSKAT